MKKLFALLMAVIMVLSMAVTASAEETEPESRSMINQSRIVIHGATAGTTYKVYRILDIASVSTDAQGKEHVVYTLREDSRVWDQFFTSDAYAKSYFTIVNNYIKEVKFVKESTDENALTAQKLAALAAKYIEDKGITADGERPVTKSGTQTGDYRQIGLYVMTSNRVVAADKTLQHYLFTLSTTDKNVYEKNAPTHSIQKLVQEDSMIVAGTDSGWQDHNNAEIAQPIHFRITVDMAPGTEDYIIRDTMTEFDHLDLNALTVKYSGGGDFLKGTHYFVNPLTDGTTGFQITFSTDFRSIIQQSDKLTIEYSACLRSQAAQVHAAPHKNKVELYHGVDKDGNAVLVDDAETNTYTYRLVVNKMNEKGEAMKDVNFVLKKNSPDAAENMLFVYLDDVSYTVTNDDNTTKTVTIPRYVVSHSAQELGAAAGGVTPESVITTNETGMFILAGLDSQDKYYLVETLAPDNYVEAEPVEIQIIPSTNDDHEYYIEIINLPGVDIPETGGMGTTIFYVVGGIMVLAAVVLLVTKKRVQA